MARMWYTMVIDYMHRRRSQTTRTESPIWHVLIITTTHRKPTCADWWSHRRSIIGSKPRCWTTIVGFAEPFILKVVRLKTKMIIILLISNPGMKDISKWYWYWVKEQPLSWVNTGNWWSGTAGPFEAGDISTYYAAVWNIVKRMKRKQ